MVDNGGVGWGVFGDHQDTWFDLDRVSKEQHVIEDSEQGSSWASLQGKLRTRLAASSPPREGGLEMSDSIRVQLAYFLGAELGPSRRSQCRQTGSHVL